MRGGGGPYGWIGTIITIGALVIMATLIILALAGVIHGTRLR